MALQAFAPENGSSSTSSVFGRPGRAPHPKRGDRVAGRYELSREVARGAMATVFEARHLVTGRAVAMKFVQGDCSQPEIAAERLKRAALALGAVRHPAIVDAYDAGESVEVGQFIALEMLEGRTLEGILAARRRLPLQESLYVVRRVGEALAFVHRRGFVHRDVRPANVFFARAPHGVETVKLIDFGLAVTVDEEPAVAEPTRGFDPLSALEYVPVEHGQRPSKRDPRSDQHALASVLLECLAGNSLVLDDDAAGGFEGLRELVPDVPRALVDALAKAMSPVPADRFADVEAFLEACGAADAKPLAIVSPARPKVDARPTTPVKAVAANEPPPAVVSRRRFQRAPYITPCRVVRADGITIDGRAEDISEGGLLIVLSQREEMKAGGSAQDGPEKVRVRFALPTTGVVATVEALVRWIKDGKGRSALGIEFTELAPDARMSIATYVGLVGTAA